MNKKLDQLISSPKGPEIGKDKSIISDILNIFKNQISDNSIRIGIMDVPFPYFIRDKSQKTEQDTSRKQERNPYEQKVKFEEALKGIYNKLPINHFNQEESTNKNSNEAYDYKNEIIQSFKKYDFKNFSKKVREVTEYVVNSCMQNLSNNQTISEAFNDLNGRSDSVTHSICVSVWNAHLATLSGCNRFEIDTSAMVGILHDIGKKKIPKEILNKEGAFTKTEELQMIHDHPIYSFYVIFNAFIDKFLEVYSIEEIKDKIRLKLNNNLKDDFNSLIKSISPFNKENSLTNVKEQLNKLKEDAKIYSLTYKKGLDPNQIQDIILYYVYEIIFKEFNDDVISETYEKSILNPEIKKSLYEYMKEENKRLNLLEQEKENDSYNKIADSEIKNLDDQISESKLIIKYIYNLVNRSQSNGIIQDSFQEEEKIVPVEIINKVKNKIKYKEYNESTLKLIESIQLLYVSIVAGRHHEAYFKKTKLDPSLQKTINNYGINSTHKKFVPPIILEIIKINKVLKKLQGITKIADDTSGIMADRPYHRARSIMEAYMLLISSYLNGVYAPLPFMNGFGWDTFFIRDYFENDNPDIDKNTFVPKGAITFVPYGILHFLKNKKKFIRPKIDEENELSENVRNKYSELYPDVLSKDLTSENLNKNYGHVYKKYEEFLQDMTDEELTNTDLKELENMNLNDRSITAEVIETTSRTKAVFEIYRTKKIKNGEKTEEIKIPICNKVEIDYFFYLPHTTVLPFVKEEKISINPETNEEIVTEVEDDTYIK